MRLAAIAFTARGAGVAEQLVRQFRDDGEDCRGYGLGQAAVGPDNAALQPVDVSLTEWAGRRFRDRDGIIFVGAAGIAVRSVAPHLRGKDRDPAVVVVDELGRFAISLLSGHLGGANELARSVAGILGAQPVITTATDLNNRFAVDLFAGRLGLAVGDLKTAKEISSAVLAGAPVGFQSDFPVEGELPEGLVKGCDVPLSIWITVRRETKGSGLRILRLVPRIVFLGIGCRKGVGAKSIAALVDRALRECDLDPASVAAVASIDLKEGEPGLVEYAHGWNKPFHTYSARELAGVGGLFKESEFVRRTTGVGNVCERAALLAACRAGEGARLIMEKRSGQGVTVAAAATSWKVVI